MESGSKEPVEIDGMICYPKDEEPLPPPEEEEKVDVLETCPRDPRFPQQNVTKWCYQMFIDFHRCMFLLESEKECSYFKRCYTSICPVSWVEKWEEQIEEGSFPRNLRCEYHYRQI